MFLRVLSCLTTLSLYVLAALILAGIYASKIGVDSTLVNNYIVCPGFLDFIVIVLLYVYEGYTQESQAQKKEAARLERLRRFRGR